MLLELATAADLFHTADGTAYADLPIDGHRETWPLRSPRFRAWLRRLCYKATGEALSAAALNSALNLLEAAPSLTVRSGPCTFGSPNTRAVCISISLILAGVRSKSDRRIGGSLPSHRCASAGHPACCRIYKPIQVVSDRGSHTTPFRMIRCNAIGPSH
jgi:hypothetical protein